MQTRYLALAVSLACSSAVVQADQNNDESIEKLVVVSSRVATPIREVATSVSVVTEEEIALRGFASLADILRVQPAVNVNHSGGIGSTTSLRIRGEEGYRTLVLVDGVDISDPTGTQVGPKLGHLLGTNVTRVEILRGTQGMSYGADAGGVINVQTGRYQEENFGSITAEVGRYATTNLAAEFGGANGSFDYYLSAADYETEGFNSRTDDTIGRDNDGYENTTLHARFGYQFNDNLKVGFVARSNNGEGEFDSCGFGASASNDCSSKFEQDNIRLNAQYNTDTSEHQLAFSKSLITRENFNQESSSFFTKGYVERLEYVGNTYLNDENRLIYGIDWEKEAITSAGQNRTQKGYFLEYQSELVTDVFVTAGLRYDDNEDFGSHTSYRLSAAKIWSVASNELKLRASYGTGFRAPSLFEVEYNRGPWAFAPASETELKEEQTRGYELALQYSTDDGSSYEIVYFDQEIDDSIYFDLAGFSGYLQDTGKSFSDGFEVIVDKKLTDSLSLSVNYTSNDTEDTAGSQRVRRPKRLANIGVNYNVNQWQMAANLRFVGDFVDNGQVELDDYHVLDISARYNIGNGFTLFGRIENALDEDYQDITTFNTAGSAAHVGLKYQF